MWSYRIYNVQFIEATCLPADTGVCDTPRFFRRWLTLPWSATDQLQILLRKKRRHRTTPVEGHEFPVFRYPLCHHRPSTIHSGRFERQRTLFRCVRLPLRMAPAPPPLK